MKRRRQYEKPAPVESPTVGFGDDVSRRATTRTMNAFVQVATTPVHGGADVRVSARRGYVIVPEVEQDAGEVTVHVRRDSGPHIGDTLMVGKRHVTVAKRRWDPHGRLQVMDEDSGIWVAVP